LKEVYESDVSNIRNVLSHIFEKAISFTGTNELTIKIPLLDTKEDREKKISFAELFQCLDHLSMFDQKLQKFSTQFFKFILQPLLELDSTLSIALPVVSVTRTETEESKKAKKKKQHQLEIITIQNVHSLFDKLSRCIECIHNTLGVTVISKLGAPLWSPLCDSIINHYLSECIPETTDQLEKYKKEITVIVKNFESKLTETGRVVKTITKYAGCREILLNGIFKNLLVKKCVI